MWFRPQAAVWPDIEALTRKFAWQKLTWDEGGLRLRFWRKLLREAAKIPFLEEVLTAHYCAFDRQTPLYVKAILIGAITYFVVPMDLIPDYIPVVGYTDDAAVVGAAVKAVAAHIRPEHRTAAQLVVARLRGELPSRP